MSEEIVDGKTFVSKMKQLYRLSGWGVFIIIAIFPILFIASILVNDVFFLIWIVLLFGFAGVVALLESRVMRSAFDLWFDFAKIHVARLKMVLPVIFGSVAGSILLSLLTLVLFGHPLRSLAFFLVVIFVLILPAYHLALRYVQKKFSGEGSRFVHGTKDEVEDLVKKALDSLHLKYQNVREGSRWTQLVPSYRVEDSGVSVKVYRQRVGVMRIATKAQSPEDVPKAREIENRIDSFLNIIRAK